MGIAASAGDGGDAALDSERVTRYTHRVADVTSRRARRSVGGVIYIYRARRGGAPVCISGSHDQAASPLVTRSHHARSARLLAQLPQFGVRLKILGLREVVWVNFRS